MWQPYKDHSAACGRSPLLLTVKAKVLEVKSMPRTLRLFHQKRTINSARMVHAASSLS